MILFRPVGLHELRLVALSEFREFPPRFRDQPIFYPVLDLEYARQIARDWNAPDPSSGFAGFVTRFEITESLAARYPVRVAAASRHRELWVPAEELVEFNEHIQDRIVVIEAYPGPEFVGTIDPETLLPSELAKTR
jgi:hypothetical protein